MSYEYDDAGRRIAMTYPGGTDEVTYEYDAANRLVSVTDWNADETTYAYDNANRMTTVTFPSAVDVVSMFTYDDADRLTGIDHVQGGTTTLAFVDYTLDAVGNRTERDDDEGTHSYEYDDLHRLTEVTYPGPSTTGYVYDAFGNRTSMTVGMDTTTYSYDDADRLTSLTPPGESAVTYTWDDNGNLTDRGSDEFEWDYEDRMVSATVDSAETTFAYRGDGLRESRTFNSSTVTFTWDIAAGLPVVIDDEDARYVYGAGLVSQVTSGESYYYLADGLGSTMVTVDSDGDVVNSYTYDVFGETRSESGSQANEFQFAGQQVDGSTGLQYLRARYYDMETGRFISRDAYTAQPGRGVNSTEYAYGNPTRFVDRTGLEGGEQYIGGSSEEKATDDEFSPHPGSGWQKTREVVIRKSKTFGIDDLTNDWILDTVVGIKIPKSVMDRVAKLKFGAGPCLKLIGCEYQVKRQLWMNEETGKWHIRVVREWSVVYQVGIGVGGGWLGICFGLIERREKVYTEDLSR